MIKNKHIWAISGKGMNPMKSLTYFDDKAIVVIGGKLLVRIDNVARGPIIKSGAFSKTTSLIDIFMKLISTHTANYALPSERILPNMDIFVKEEQNRQSRRNFIRTPDCLGQKRDPNLFRTRRPRYW